MSILKSLTSNKYTVQDSFTITQKIVEKGSEFFMENLDVVLIHFSKIRKKIERLSKTYFKENLSLVTKESYFIFSGQLCKQFNEIAMPVSVSDLSVSRC